MNEKEWTIMIYMAGDNNLAVDMAYALEQIKGVAGKDADSPNLFVYYDGNSPSIPTMYCDFSEADRPRYVQSYQVPNKLCYVPEKKNENAAHWKSVLNFIDWCVNQAPVIDENGEITNGRRSKRYALIFSGHTLGFQDIGLFKDETSGKSMNMQDLYFILQRIVNTKEQLDLDVADQDYDDDERYRRTKVLVGQKFDILGFDSCVMGMLEVGYQFGYAAHTMIASEGSVPNAGWTYAKLLGNLARSKGTNERIAEQFVRDFIKSQDSFTVGGVSVDMAAWDLSKLTDLANAFDELADVLLACFEDEQSRIYRQMERVILHTHWKCQSYMYDQNVDLGDFCELLEKECALVSAELGSGDDLAILDVLREKCRKVISELKCAVILSGFSGGDYQHSNGISVFFPWSRQGYEVSKKNYQALWFTKDAREARRTSWTNFLKKYLREVALRKFEPPTEAFVPAGEKYKYYSGVKFDEMIELAATPALMDAADAESKIAGQPASKIAGQPASKIAGQPASKIAGQPASKIAGQPASKIAGQPASKIAGQPASKIAGQPTSKIAGQPASKIAGQPTSKIAGQPASKIAGQPTSKIAGQPASKLAGDEGARLGGAAGAGTTFFDNLRLFKNIESRWNVSGFSKKADEVESEVEASGAGA
jgi:hypothetical protein